MDPFSNEGDDDFLVEETWSTTAVRGTPSTSPSISSPILGHDISFTTKRKSPLDSERLRQKHISTEDGKICEGPHQSTSLPNRILRRRQRSPSPILGDERPAKRRLISIIGEPELPGEGGSEATIDLDDEDAWSNAYGQGHQQRQEPSRLPKDALGSSIALTGSRNSPRCICTSAAAKQPQAKSQLQQAKGDSSAMRYDLRSKLSRQSQELKDITEENTLLRFKLEKSKISWHIMGVACPGVSEFMRLPLSEVIRLYDKAMAIVVPADGDTGGLPGGRLVGSEHVKKHCLDEEYEDHDDTDASDTESCETDGPDDISGTSMDLANKSGRDEADEDSVLSQIQCILKQPRRSTEEARELLTRTRIALQELSINGLPAPDQTDLAAAAQDMIRKGDISPVLSTREEVHPIQNNTCIIPDHIVSDEHRSNHRQNGHDKDVHHEKQQHLQVPTLSSATTTTPSTKDTQDLIPFHNSSKLPPAVLSDIRAVLDSEEYKRAERDRLVAENEDLRRRVRVLLNQRVVA